MPPPDHPSRSKARLVGAAETGTARTTLTEDPVVTLTLWAVDNAPAVYALAPDHARLVAEALVGAADIAEAM